MRRDADRPLFKDVVEGTAAHKDELEQTVSRARQGLDLGAHRPAGARDPARRRLRAGASPRRAAPGRDQRICRDRARLLRPGRADLREFGARPRGAPGALGRTRAVAGDGRGAIGEFELIARYFAPLAKGFAGARRPQERQRLPRRPTRGTTSSVKTDTIVCGRAFPRRREARAGRGAGRCASACPILRRAAPTPYAYQLSLSLHARLDRALGRRLRARARRRPAPLRHRAVAAATRPARRARRRSSITAFGKVRARQGAGTRRRAGRGRALGERHDRRRRARPAGGARRVDERRPGAALSPAAAAHDARAAPGRHRDRDGRHLRRPAGRRRPHRRCLAACGADRARSRAAVARRRGVRVDASHRSWATCWAAATTTNW